MSCPMNLTSTFIFCTFVRFMYDVRLFSVPAVNSSLSKVDKSGDISMFSGKNSSDGGGQLLKGPLKSFI